MSLWPAGFASFRVRPQEDSAAVENVGLLLIPASGAAKRGRAQPKESAHLSCPVRERRVESCSVPAGLWNLRVEAPGFAPHHLWAVEIEVGAQDLGSFDLRRGGSVFGRVVVPGGEQTAEAPAVELRPLLDPGALTEDSRRELEQLARTVRVDPRGYFQLVGVPAGVFEVTARHPGFSPAVWSPVELRQGEWTELEEPLVLEPLLRLGIQVDPAATPFGKPWTIRLYRPESSQVLQVESTGVTDSAGSWRSPPLPAGPYEVQVLDERESSLAWRTFELGEGSEELLVELPLVFVEGEVLLDEEPVQAELWFGGRSGAERVRADSSEKGEFFAILPEEGAWMVDVIADDPPVRSMGLEVEVEPIADLRVAEVVVELPDTRIVGEVVDEAGLPLTQAAQLQMVPLGGDHRRARFLGADTDAAGRFEIVAAPPGAYSVAAESPQGSSDSVVVSVTEGREIPVRLILHPERTLIGIVVSTSGPVPQALVMAYPLAAPGQRPALDFSTARTGMDGRFRMEVPGNATTLQLTVMAPGHSLAVKRVSEGSRVEVALHRAGGTLLLEPSLGGGSEVGLVMVQGQPLDLQRLESWTRMNGTRVSDDEPLVVPAMPPGDYAYCELSMEEALLVISGMALPSGGGCTQGFLAPGGELRLDAPS